MSEQCRLCQGKGITTYTSAWSIDKDEKEFILDVNDEYGLKIHYCPNCGRSLYPKPMESNFIDYEALERQYTTDLNAMDITEMKRPNLIVDWLKAHDLKPNIKNTMWLSKVHMKWFSNHIKESLGEK